MTDILAGGTFHVHFTTFRPSTGAPHTLAGTPAVSVYKDGSNTQSTAGVTLTADFDSVTGLNLVAVDTSADGTFYSAGSSFSLVVTTGTVDSVSAVGMVVGSFSIARTAAYAKAVEVEADIAALNDLSTGDVAGAVLNAAMGDYTTPDTVGAVLNDTELMVIEVKAKTDSLNFTVAGQVNANITYVNDVEVTGTGKLGDEWRPV
jgi:hypothetical protein